MKYIFQMHDVWDVCEPAVKDVTVKLLEKGYTVSYKQKDIERVVLSVSKEHSAELTFRKESVNDLIIEIDLENYFSRVSKNIAKVSKSLLFQTLGVSVGCCAPPCQFFDPLTSLTKLLASGVVVAGSSNLPLDLRNILTECLGQMGEIKCCNWEDILAIYSSTFVF